MLKSIIAAIKARYNAQYDRFIAAVLENTPEEERAAKAALLTDCRHAIADFVPMCDIEAEVRQ